MSRVTVPQFPWDGPRGSELEFPEKWDVEVHRMAGRERRPMTDEEIDGAIQSTIGSPPLREIAADRREVVILFDDMSRCTRAFRIIPSLLAELASAGIPDSRIRFLGSSGCHGPMGRTDFVKKLGEGVLARFPVFNHNPWENCADIGTTTFGTAVQINKEVLHCDLKIAVGVCCPHGLVGFSGVAKMILPGVASIDSIAQNHLAARGTSWAYDDMLDAADMAGLDFGVECIVDEWGETVALFAGTPRAIRGSSVEFAKLHYLVERAEDKDIVVANAYFKANEAPMALSTASALKRTGGDFVLLSNVPDGLVVHFYSGTWGTTIGGRAQKQVDLPDYVRTLYIHNEYPDLASLGYFHPREKVQTHTLWARVIDSLATVHTNPAVVVYPNAETAYFGPVAATRSGVSP